MTRNDRRARRRGKSVAVERVVRPLPQRQSSAHLDEGNAEQSRFRSRISREMSCHSESSDASLDLRPAHVDTAARGPEYACSSDTTLSAIMFSAWSDDSGEGRGFQMTTT